MPDGLHHRREASAEQALDTVRTATTIGEGWGPSPPTSMEETMSSTASLITVLASVAFGLIVIGVGHRLFGERTS
jgi:hypothetical protein